MRIGFGYDVHQLVANRKLILGGIDIPHEKGLLGHSDADVLVHAIMDSILGALGLGDIGGISQIQIINIRIFLAYIFYLRSRRLWIEMDIL